MSDETPRRRTMTRRFITRGAIFLICGIVLTVASALPVLWVREIPGQFVNPTGYGSKQGVRLFTIHDETKDTMDRGFTGVVPTSKGPWWSRTWEAWGEPIDLSWEIVTGSPLPAFSAGVIRYYASPYSDPSIEWGMPISKEGMRVTFGARIGVTSMEWPMRIPTRIIWRGLIANTIFYAATVWLVIAILELCRRAMRRQRGLCEGCAYSLRGLESAARCPECGRGVARRAERRTAAPVR